MKVNLLKQKKENFKYFSARKYAQLKKTRHHRTGKQHSVDDDEEDIGMIDFEKNLIIEFVFQIMHLIVIVVQILNVLIVPEHLCVNGIFDNV